MPDNPDWEMICVDMGAAGIVVIDPRGIVRNAAGERVWGPRDVPLDSHGPFYLEWLIDNPDWDRRS